MKVLFIHASAGAGHLKAAEALFNGITKHFKHDAAFVDALDHCHPTYRSLYRGSYAFMITKVPWLWKWVFELLDVDWLQPFVRRVRRVYNSINARGVQKYIEKEQFDYIFSTHFMPTEISAALKRSGKITSKIVTVITDYDVHKIWLADGVDYYCVASEWTREKMKMLGVPVVKVYATGVPTDEKFASPKDILDLKKKLGLHADLFTVLIATGSFGIGPIEQIITQLKGFQVIVVCGHNKDLFLRLGEKHQELVKVMGLVDNMYELMAVSDAMVTKPGGLSVSEALVSHLPMIFFNTIPGQEAGNIRVLGSYGIGVNTRSVPEIVGQLTDLKKSKDKFLTALKRTAILARPSAVLDILSLIK